jgi:hypothetical protein
LGKKTQQNFFSIDFPTKYNVNTELSPREISQNITYTPETIAAVDMPQTCCPIPSDLSPKSATK